MVMVCRKIAVACLEGKGIDELEATCRQRAQRTSEQRSGDAPTPMLGCGHEADDHRCFVRCTWKRRRGDAHAVKAVWQLMQGLRVQPTDDLLAVVSEEALHFADFDARAHGHAILLGRQRLPWDRRRHLIKVAIAFRPLRIIAECAATLMIEESEKVGSERRAQRFDNEMAHRRTGFSSTTISAVKAGLPAFTSPVSA